MIQEQKYIHVYTDDRNIYIHIYMCVYVCIYTHIHTHTTLLFYPKWEISYVYAH